METIMFFCLKLMFSGFFVGMTVLFFALLILAAKWGWQAFREALHAR